MAGFCDFEAYHGVSKDKRMTVVSARTVSNERDVVNI